MSTTQWEYDMVEPPFCERLKAMRCQWINGDTDAPDFTKLSDFRGGLLKARLAPTRREFNLRVVQPWLDEPNEVLAA